MLITTPEMINACSLAAALDRAGRRSAQGEQKEWNKIKRNGFKLEISIEAREPRVESN